MLASRKLATVAALAAFGVLAGCAAPAPTKIQSSFNHAAHDAYLNAGRNTVRGQGFLRQKGGTVVTCAGSPVMMIPDTAFFQEFMQIGMSGRKPEFTGKVDEKYRPLLRQGQCDAQGNFIFTDVPNGAWIVATEVTWEVGRYSLREGGIVQQTVTVTGNETKQVLLTR